MKRAAPIVFVLVCLVAATAWSHKGAVEASRADKSAGSVPLEYLPSSDAAPFLAIGHRPSLADLFWIRSVLYFATEIETRRSFEWLVQYMDVVMALDPDFKDLYQWGGTVLIISNKVVSTDNVMMANEILERGANRFPDDHKLLEAAAANCSYYVRNPSPEEREELKACRKKYIEMSASRPGAPYMTILLAASLAEGDEQRACDLLIDAYFSSDQDPTLRQQVERRMKGGLCGDITPEQLQRQHRRFQQAHVTHYPYLPGDLMVHVATVRDVAESEDDRDNQETMNGEK